MSDECPVRVTALAARQIREAEEWWRLNRTAAPNAIWKELQDAFALIASRPAAGGRATNVKLPGVRRIYLPRIKYHVYYHVLHEPECVEVVAFCHVRRGESPPI